jgi:hypothetical protein
MKWLEKFITRKFVAATLTAFLMSICWIVSQWLPGAREHLPALFTGLVAALSAYTAGNVAQDHVLKGKEPQKLLATVPNPPIEPHPEETR